jgi:transcriptional regulator with XRE-family HTH domain
MTTATLSAQIRSAIRSLIAAGQSQTDIARRADVRQPALSQWLAGKKQFNEANLDRLAAIVGFVVVANASIPTAQTPNTQR